MGGSVLVARLPVDTVVVGDVSSSAMVRSMVSLGWMGAFCDWDDGCGCVVSLLPSERDRFFPFGGAEPEGPELMFE